MTDKIKDEVTQVVKDAINLHVPQYLEAALRASSIEVYEINVHAITDRIICVRVKETKDSMSRHFEVRVKEAL